MRRRLASLVVALVIALGSVGGAGADQGSPEEWSLLIREVVLDDSDWVWQGSLRDGLNLRVGEVYRPAEAVRFLSLLRATGYFTGIDMVTVFEPAGVTVRFELTPNDVVRQVGIKGNLLLLKKEIRPVLRAAPNDIFDPGELERDAQRIRELYKRRGFFGTEVKARAVRTGRPHVLDIVYEVDEGNPGVIQRIAFEGLENVDPNELKLEHRLITLSFYDPDDVEEATERLVRGLRHQGFIEARVEVEILFPEGLAMPSLSILQPVKSLRAFLPGDYVGVEIVFRVALGDRFEIDVQGNEQAGTDELREMISFYRSGFFDIYEADESRDVIQEYYQNLGYLHVSVTYDLEVTERRVRFDIIEGPVVSVERIEFSGNRSVDDAKLLGLMDLRPPPVGSRKFRSASLESDINTIRAYYLSRGYTRASVTQRNAVFDVTGRKLTLFIDINEGPRASTRNLDFRGNAVISSNRLAEAVLPRGGMVFSPDWLEGAKRRVLDLYGRLGYADCTVNAEANVSEEGRWADVVFSIREGRRRVFGNLLVQGNRRTRVNVVARELGMSRGDPYDPIRIYEARRRLFELGLFSRIDLVNPEQHNVPETDLIVKVKERKTLRFSFGVGYDSVERYRGFAEIGEENLFGTGRGIRLRYKLSTIGRRYDAVYKEPWVLGYDQDVSFNLYDEFRQETGYDLRRLGVRVFSDRSLDRYTGLYTAYRYETVDYRDVRPSLLDAEQLPDEFRIGSVQVRLSYDRRDNAVNPHRGYYASGSVELASPLIGSDPRYNKYEFQASYVQPTGSRSELVFSSRLGLAHRLVDEDELPLSERFFAGGANTVRGYAEKALGPKDSGGTPLGGELMVLANVEWRFKLYRSMGGVVFLDAGNVWPLPEDFRPSDLGESAGVGLRYETPVGPVRLEYGHKLDPAPGEDRYRVHFTLGHPF